MTHIPEHPFVLVDGSSYLYRAFYALPQLTNSKGQPTGAIFGVINMLKKLINDYQPEHIAVVFDAKGKTFRDELFEQYKATRSPMPNELISQLKPLKEIVKAMGLPLLEIEGVEADDVIGTLATQAQKQGLYSLISTGDKDMAQIVNDRVTLINTMSNTILDPEGVKNKFGIGPELIIDYLTLVGDKVDNIPGIPGVGPKTAVKWLTEFGSLDAIIENAEQIKGKVGEKLRDNLTNLELSRKLATIKLDVELDINPKGLAPNEPETEELIELFKELEFKSWLSELLAKTEQTKKQQREYKKILTENELQAWISKITKADVFAIDTETTSLNALQAELVGISLAVNADEAAYIPVAHDYEAAPTQLAREQVLDKLKPILEDNKQLKLGHNLKYDLHVLANYGIKLNGIAYDTMLESYVLNSSGSRHDLDTLALKYLGCNTIHYEDVAGKGAKQVTFDQVDIDAATEYAAEDADITLQLHQTLWPKVEAISGIKYIFDKIEMPLLTVLSRVERNGVLVDKKMLATQSKQLTKRMAELQQEAYDIAGEEFNLGSPKQLQKIFYEKLSLPILQKTPKGQPSTAEAVLQELALDYPLPKVILEYRGLSKLKSTYTDTLPLQINPQTGRVHTSYNQAVAATGRLSSTEPNLQNIPVRTPEGRRIRQAFIAEQGYKIVACDYSQIELRIMAHLSKDKGLLTAFANGLDIHKATAAEVFGIALDKVNNDQRRSAKAINFGLIYGMSAFGLSRQLGIDPKLAREYMDLYFHRYPGVKDYMENTRNLAHEQGYVETLFGRRLYLPEINASNMQRQRAAERAAINAPMQGTAADIIKLAMIAVDAWLLDAKLDARMIMQVHDELVFEIAEKDVKSAINEITGYMMNAAKLDVPLIVDSGVGDNWDEAH